MTLDDLPVPIKECLAAFSALRKLGFAADEIAFCYGNNGHVGICLNAQQREFVISMGHLAVKDPSVVWSTACARWTSDETPQAELDRLYKDSKMRRLGLALVERLVEHGFTLPRAVN